MESLSGPWLEKNSPFEGAGKEGEKTRVLVVSENQEDFFLIQGWLAQIKDRIYSPEWLPSYETARDAIRQRLFDVCLIDYRLGSFTGLDLLRAARKEEHRPPMILLTSQGDYEVDVEAMNAGAADFLLKDRIDANSLERSLRYSIERHRVEERIREQASLLDLAHDAILVCDLEDRILFWNRGAENLYGWTAEQALGRRTGELLFKEPFPDLAEALGSLREKGKWSGEFQQITRDGREVFVESRWTILHDTKGQAKSKLVTNTDITDKKKLQAQFLRTQRLESIGTLAGGIAHDLNNLLTPILMASKLLKKNRSDNERRQLLETLQASAERGAEMVKQLLSFAGGLEGQRVKVHMEQTISELKTLLDHTLPKSIQVHIEVAKDLWPILGDPTQLSQVLMNLCVNARDAMLFGGVLTILAENSVLDESARIHLKVQPGPYVIIWVIDTGTGIPRDVIDKVFDPFFTTKEPGKGTGLGLSTGLGIVKNHGGFIHVYSEMSKGTRFAVYLPALVAEDAGPREEESPELPPGRGETVLVVDDEVFILQTARTALEAGGYRVLTAKDGQEAVKVFRKYRPDVKAVVLDMMMPVMDGPATIESLHKLEPGLPIIATSGFRVIGRGKNIVAEGTRAYLQKPYSDEQLLAVLGKVLAGS